MKNEDAAFLGLAICKQRRADDQVPESIAVHVAGERNAAAKLRAGLTAGEGP